jgi:hypothetical protein
MLVQTLKRKKSQMVPVESTNKTTVLEDANVILFTVNLSLYDRLCSGGINNRMIESLSFFEVQYKLYHSLEWYLIFTHIDVFMKRIHIYKNIKEYFNEYEGGDADSEAATEFFKSKFLKIAKSIDEKEIPSFVIKATDTEEIEKMCELLGKTLIDENIEKNIIDIQSKELVRTKSLAKNNKPMIGSYEILGRLGRGSFGIVYKVINTSTSEVFALKSISYQSENELQMIQKEISVLKELSHPNVIHLIDYFQLKYYGTLNMHLLVIKS